MAVLQPAHMVADVPAAALPSPILPDISDSGPGMCVYLCPQGPQGRGDKMFQSILEGFQLMFAGFNLPTISPTLHPSSFPDRPVDVNF